MEPGGQAEQKIVGEFEYSLTASHLLEYLFCPRFSYFEYVLDIPQREEKGLKHQRGGGLQSFILDSFTKNQKMPNKAN